MRFGFTSTPCLRVHPSVDRGACCVPFSGVPPTANRRRCGQALCCAICLWGRLRLPDAPHGTATRSSNRHNIANGMRQPTAWASHEIRGATPAPPYQAPRSAARGTESLPAGMIASHVRSPLLSRHRCHTVSALCDMSPRRPGKAKPPKRIPDHHTTLTLIWARGAQSSVATGCATWSIQRIESPRASIRYFPVERRRVGLLFSSPLPLF